jgi:hypothetical protein
LDKKSFKNLHSGFSSCHTIIHHYQNKDNY